MLDTVVISGDDVYCSVVLGTLVGVFVFSVIIITGLEVTGFASQFASENQPVANQIKI